MLISAYTPFENIGDAEERERLGLSGPSETWLGITVFDIGEVERISDNSSTFAGLDLPAVSIQMKSGDYIVPLGAFDELHRYWKSYKEGYVNDNHSLKCPVDPARYPRPW